jgi:hypothetical protein
MLTILQAIRIRLQISVSTGKYVDLLSAVRKDGLEFPISIRGIDDCEF